MLGKNISFLLARRSNGTGKGATILLAAALLAERLSVGLRSEYSAHIAQRRWLPRESKSFLLGTLVHVPKRRARQHSLFRLSFGLFDQACPVQFAYQGPAAIRTSFSGLLPPLVVVLNGAAHA
jgi:hypothetical protein